LGVFNVLVSGRSKEGVKNSSAEERGGKKGRGIPEKAEAQNMLLLQRKN